MLSLIQSFESERVLSVERTTLPAVALVEDDDAYRFLLTDRDRLLARTWADAYSSGAVAIVYVWRDSFVAMTAETFLEHHGQDAITGELVAPRPLWTRSQRHFPSYREILGARPAPLPLDLDDVHKPTARSSGVTRLIHLHAHSEYCLAPETRVVTADLQWKRIDEVVVDEQLVGFDEDLRPPDGERRNSRSKMRRTTVEAVKRVRRECYRIKLVDGTEIISSAQHGWVVTGTTRGSTVAPGASRGGWGANTRRWLTTEQLCASQATSWQTRTLNMPSLVLWARPWAEVPTDLLRECAWLAGVADGEAWLHDGQFSFGQNPGPVLDAIYRACKALGYEVTQERVQNDHGDCRTFRLSGYETVLRFLAQCRPVRFMDRTDEVWVGRRAGSRITRPVRVVAVEYLGERETIAIQTSTKTFVAEGFLSHNSALDGLSTIGEMVSAAVAHDQPAIAVTDHGVCSAHPQLQAEATKMGIKPIFGMEANFVDDRHRRGTSGAPEDDPDSPKRVLADYRHLILWAVNDTGLRNLWAMSSIANLEGFYGRPRLDWEVLQRYHQGVMCSTACLRGPLSTAILAEDEELLQRRLAGLQGIFGDGLFIELHTNQLAEQRLVNKTLAAVAKTFSIPTIVVCDSHYPCAEDKQLHQIWIASQTNKDLAADDQQLFAGGQDYHLMDVAEVHDALSTHLPDHVIDESIANTTLVAELCNATVRGDARPPTYSKQGGPARDLDRLVDLCIKAWPDKIHPQRHDLDVYYERFEYECRVITDAGFCGYFLMVWDYVNWAKDHGILVGPGRGSGAGSLVAYLLGITGIDPVEAGLMFERFLTPGRKSLPDFDVDFPSSKRDVIESYIRDRWGAEHVARVGTNLRLKNKAVVRDLQRVLGSEWEVDYRDIDAVCKIIDAAEAGAAGLGVPWDELWVEHDDVLGPYRAKYGDFFATADKLVGRLKSYGKHPAGMVIAPDQNLYETIPMRHAGKGADAEVVSAFDMDAAELLGLIKFDILTLRTLDTIQMALDLIEERFGTRIDPWSWVDEYADPQVWDDISNGFTLGIFQIETRAGTRLAKRFRPQSVHDLADVITLVRPGPTRSGLTDTYFLRREGRQEISYVDDRLADVLAKTQGCMIYQEQVMQTCQLLAGYTLQEADQVRKILGKKKVALVAAEGEKFVPACVQRGMNHDAAEMLFDQMAEFAKYCVTGDTEVSLAAAGGASNGRVSVEDLYRRIHAPMGPPRRGGRGVEPFGGPCSCCGRRARKYVRDRCQACYVWLQKFLDPNRGVYGLTVNADDRIRPARILDVIANGVQPVFTITLEDGRVITATENHRHLTRDGFKTVMDLDVGDALLIDGGYEKHRYRPDESRTTRGERGPRGYVDGGWAKLMAWTLTAPQICEECGHDGSEHRLERAHLDGDRTNNEPENLRMLCVSCHKKHDYFHNDRLRRWQKGHPTVEMKIIDIAYAGTRPTFSVVMDDPHIWIANGIATANSFNLAHAYGYAVLGVWTAWLKTHYPLQFLTAILSTVDKGRIPEFITEARRMGYTVKPPDINESGHGFRATDVDVRYGLDSVKGIGNAAVEAITQGQPYEDWDDFLARKGSACNVGAIKTLAAVGAFDRWFPNRKSLERRLESEAKGDHERCVFKNDTTVGPNGLPCDYDWINEPPEIGKTGRPKKLKPVPKRCTKACRHYTPPDPASLTYACDPYTDVEIREREREMLGVYLSSTPFDRIPWDDPDTADIITATEVDIAPDGLHVIAATIERIRETRDRHNRSMAFLTLFAQDGNLDVVCFHDDWTKLHDKIRLDALCFAVIRKNDRGHQLVQMVVL